jgi:prepilin-type N-terminal cleavage/methylation domain-containing protein
MSMRRRGLTLLEFLVVVAIIAVAMALVLGGLKLLRRSQNSLAARRVSPTTRIAIESKGLGTGYDRRRRMMDSSGLGVLTTMLPRWKPDASLQEISEIWNGAGYRAIEQVDLRLAGDALPEGERIKNMLIKSELLNYEGQPEKSYEVLEQLRSFLEQDERYAKIALASVIYYQGVTAMRRGENDNCVMCRGESSCILPVSTAAVHANPTGSRLAIRHFTEYLNQFPDDLEVRWLLNLAHMTLGEYPDKVDSQF